jgi:molybdenum cofactor synthesis domain-containing protein
VRVAVLTVSDGVARGLREDRGGPAIVDWCAAHGHAVVARAVVPDGTLAIVQRLLAWCDGDVADVVLVTGGTGLAPRDLTPEALRAVAEREVPGLAERLRVPELDRFPRAALSRSLAIVRARTLVVALPGSPNGVREGLAALAPLLDHAVAIVRDAPTDHSPGAPAARPVP